VRLRTTPVFKAYQITTAMSALGQKQTCAVHSLMSAKGQKRHHVAPKVRTADAG
jgi:hypothetical protein